MPVSHLLSELTRQLLHLLRTPYTTTHGIEKELAICQSCLCPGWMRFPVFIWSSHPNPGHMSGKDENTTVSIPMFTAALFIIAKTWKQEVSIDRWMDREDVVCIYIYTHTYIHTYIHVYTHTHNGILLSYKKEWNIAICNNIDGPREYHTKWSKQEKDE